MLPNVTCQSCLSMLNLEICQDYDETNWTWRCLVCNDVALDSEDMEKWLLEIVKRWILHN